MSGFSNSERYHFPANPPRLGAGFRVVEAKSTIKVIIGAYNKMSNQSKVNPFCSCFNQNAVPSPSLSYLAIMAMLAMIKSISTRESPEPVFQLLPCLNSCSMTFPMSRILLPPSRSEMTKVVRDGTNTMVIPLMMPGTLRGRMILTNVWMLFAPISRAAEITSRSILDNTL